MPIKEKLSTAKCKLFLQLSTESAQRKERRRFSTWIPQENVETGQCLELMLVVISFTTSAKAGSERIWVSTLSSEWSTVV